MTKYQLPTPKMFAVHAHAVRITQVHWAMRTATEQFQASMGALAQSAQSALLGLQRLSEALAKLKQSKNDGDET